MKTMFEILFKWFGIPDMLNTESFEKNFKWFGIPDMLSDASEKIEI